MGEGLFASDGTDHQHFTYQYNAIGNILTHSVLIQSGRGTYRHDASGSCTPGTGGGAYAVKCIEGTVNGYTNLAFSYDANGNMTAGMGRTLTCTSYNMPSQVVGVGYSGGSSTYNYVYNAEHERTKLVPSTLGTFIYLHPAGKGQLLYEKQAEASPSTRIEHSRKSFLDDLMTRTQSCRAARASTWQVIRSTSCSAATTARPVFCGRGLPLLTSLAEARRGEIRLCCARLRADDQARAPAADGGRAERTLAIDAMAGAALCLVCKPFQQAQWQCLGRALQIQPDPGRGP